MADPVPAGSDVSSGTYKCTNCGYDLQVGSTLVRGESALARRAGTILEDGRPADLAELGVGWIVVYLDDPQADELDVAGLEPVTRSADVAVYRVPDANPDDGPDEGPGKGAEVAVVTVDLAVLGGLLALVFLRLRGVRRNRVPTDLG